MLNFRANGSMRMGHVAVVNQVVDSRTIEIDHANWGGPGAIRGGISRDISVVDVSPSNDWSAVRVALGHSGEFGSIYPTYGFIYNRPDHGTMVAANDNRAPVPSLNPAPRDLRGFGAREVAFDEVAEAPDDAGATHGTSFYRGRHVHRVSSAGRRHTRRRLTITGFADATEGVQHTAPVPNPPPATAARLCTAAMPSGYRGVQLSVPWM